jgi:hypothetical protein
VSSPPFVTTTISSRAARPRERALEGDAERALAGLHAVGKRRVEEIHAARQQLRHRLAVEQVVDAADLPGARAEPEARDAQAVRAAEVTGQVRKARGEASRPLRRRPAGNPVDLGHGAITARAAVLAPRRSHLRPARLRIEGPP